MGSCTTESVINPFSGSATDASLAYAMAQQRANQQQCFSQMQSAYQQPRTAQQKKVTMLGSIKKYFDDHRDLLMTLAVLVIVDQWVFDGAFKEKIKGLMDRVVGHADNKIKQLEAKS